MKVVIPAAGLGTRMLPATKEQPKEMLPIFSRTEKNKLCLKPIIQLIFEQLYAFDLRNFCFIIGRGKRALENYFTPDNENINLLRIRGKESIILELQLLYEKIISSKIVWINQSEQKGFGDAVLQSEVLISEEDFLVHAGDTYIVSNGSHLKRLFDAYKKFDADAVFAVKRVKNPSQFGVIRAKKLESDIFRVFEAIEKPEEPPTDYAIIPIYIFKSKIFDFIKLVKPDRRGEIQLTDGIQRMIEAGLKVIAINLKDDELWLDIGTPRLYWEALKTSHNMNHLKEAI